MLSYQSYSFSAKYVMKIIAMGYNWSWFCPLHYKASLDELMLVGLVDNMSFEFLFQCRNAAEN